MSSAPLDPKAKIEELRSVYGDVILRPLSISLVPRRITFFKGLTIASVTLVLGLILGFFGVASMALLDHQDTAFADDVKEAQQRVDRLGADLEVAEAAFSQAMEKMDGAGATVRAGKTEESLRKARVNLHKLRAEHSDAVVDKLKLVSQALSLPEQVSEVRNALLNEAAAQRDLEVAKAELRTVEENTPEPEPQSEAVETAQAKVAKLELIHAQAQRKSEEVTSRLEVIPLPNLPKYIFSLNQPTSLRHFVLRSIRILSPVLITVAVLAFLASLAVMIVPWVRNQAGRLVEGAINGVIGPLEGATRLGSPASSGLVFGSAPTLGNLAARATVITTAAAVTVGAFTLAVPGDVINLGLDRPRMSTARLELGEFGITIPGTEITVPPQNVKASLGKTSSEDDDLDGEKVLIRVPDVHLTAEADIGEGLANELQKYRKYLEDKTDVGDWLAALQDQNTQLLEKVVHLEAELARRPTLDGLTKLQEDLRIVKEAAVLTQEAVDSLGTKHEASSAAFATTTACLINNENAGAFTTLFRQETVKRNCQAYDVLADRFHQVGKDRCIMRDRFSPLKFWIDPQVHGCTVPAAAGSGNSSSPAPVGG